VWTAELLLRGPGGEPVDLRRTIASHGVADLPPMWPAADAGSFEVTFALPRGRPRTVRIAPGRAGHASLEVAGREPSARGREEILAVVRRILSLDDDLSAFYAAVARDPDLSWAAAGAGRMIKSPSVFEEVVKTICTTNCAWSATIRMVTALVSNLGEPATGAPGSGARGRAFPSPSAMAAVGEDFYREVVRAGYRGRYLRQLAVSVDSGELDLEALGAASSEDLSDGELAKRLLALPGVGPYAAAHVMMLLGRHSLLILDSWTRPTYARLVGRTSVSDAAIQRRFRRYGRFAGLAFWLFLTRSWVPEPVDAAG
jgi:3-methyladenine DNA glycosylase/8-oxoguanine DNA glycosylase